MSVVLAYTTPAIGHLFPLMALLLELRDRGHDVHVRTLSSQVELVRAQGLAAGPIDPAIEALPFTDWQAKGTRAALARTVAVACERAVLDGPDLTRTIAAVDPDVVIVDINAWGAANAAESWGGPWVRFSPYTPPISSPGTPPFGPGLAPMSGWAGRLRDAAVRPLVLGAVEKAMTPRLNALRQAGGLAPISSADEFFRGAPLTLVATSEPFEYPHPDWGDRIRSVGALSWEPPATAPAWLEQIAGPVVLVTTSSEYQADAAIVRAALAGLADEPVTVVATMPSGTADVGTVGPNARVVDFVPHAMVLDRAVVAVTHGGMGATQKALARGVPVCVVPFGRDQLEVAARVVHAHAGARIAPRRLTPESLRDAVRRATTMAAGAAAVAAGYRAAGGAPEAANAVEQLLATPVPR